ncbi:channel protein TolC [Parashewanella curva]|uniref:Channel protein TolC n=1 Tax=Parashewanella curva TaxID=2338552 RepID=A0A3L8PY88_9GAMM|nr:TolC family outer membrane protein [Parashewanella curva]RLV60294.1 channel protein TolC [Parashewanella curva]
MMINKQRKKQTGMVVGVVAGLVPLFAQGQSLEQAVAHTLDTNPQIRIAYNRFKVRKEQSNQSFGGYLPNVELTAGYGYESTNTPSTRRDASVDGDREGLRRGEAGITIRQMLFDGFATSSDYDRTTNEMNAEQWNLFSAAENTALDVTKVYIGYLHAQEVLTLSEKNLATHEEIYDQIKQRTNSGLGSVADLSQITGRLARANANVIAAKNNLLDAKAQFIRVVKQQPKDLVLPVADMDMIPKTLPESLQIATKNHPVLKAAFYDINAAKFEREATQSNYYPKFELELAGNLNNDLNGEDGITGRGAFQNDVGGHTKNYSAMIKMRYNLYAGGKDLAREKESAYKIGEAKSLRDNAHREVVEGVHLAWNALELLGPQKGYIRQHVEAAKQTQTAYVQQFSLGQRSLLDLLDTENELFESRKSYLRTELDELIAKYRVLNSTGRLLDSLRVTRPPEWTNNND